MIKCCLVILGIIVCTQIYAQPQWLIGIKAGISIPKLRAPNDNGSFSSGYQTLLGPQAGILAEYRLSEKFSLQTELNYATQGGEKKGNQRIRTKDFSDYIPAGLSLPDVLYARFNNQIVLTYLELPVMAKYSLPLSPRTRASIYGGPYVGYLIDAYGEAEGMSKFYLNANFTNEYTITLGGTTVAPVIDFNRREKIESELNKLNYGVQGGGSIACSFGKYEGLVAVGGTYGFNRLQKDPNFGDNETGSLTLSLGLVRKL